MNGSMLFWARRFQLVQSPRPDNVVVAVIWLQRTTIVAFGCQPPQLQARRVAMIW